MRQAASYRYYEEGGIIPRASRSEPSQRSWVPDRGYADFLELRTDEVRRTPLLGTSVNKATKRKDRGHEQPRPSWCFGARPRSPQKGGCF